MYLAVPWNEWREEGVEQQYQGYAGLEIKQNMSCRKFATRYEKFGRKFENFSCKIN